MTTVQVELWQLVTLLIAWVGSLCVFGLILLKKIDDRIDGQNSRINAFESKFNELIARMPLEYQRREDAIRFETVLNSKLDAIGSRIERLMEKS